MKDLNAYLALWRNEKETSLEGCAASCQKSEKIAHQIIEMLYEAKCDEDKILVDWCVDYLNQIQNLTMDKIDEMTLYILENIETYLLRTEEEKAAILNKSNSLANTQRQAIRRTKTPRTGTRSCARPSCKTSPSACTSTATTASTSLCLWNLKM